MSDRRAPGVWLWVRRLAVAVAVVAVAVAFVQTWDRTRGLPFSSAPRLALAAGCLALALLLAGRAWCDLLEEPARRVLPGFLVAQLGKYVPGGIWHAVGQVTAAAQDGVPRARGAAAFLVMSIVQVVAGAVIALPLALVADVPAAVRVVAGAAPLAVVLLHRAWMLRVVHWLARWRRLTHLDATTLPAQRAILAATARMLVVFVLLGIALQSALPAPFDPSGMLGIVAAHGLAWVLGYLVVPLPAGLGAREAVLVLGAGWYADPGTLIAGSLVLRLLQIMVEMVLAGVTRTVARRRATAPGTSSGAPNGTP